VISQDNVPMCLGRSFIFTGKITTFKRVCKRGCP